MQYLYDMKNVFDWRKAILLFSESRLCIKEKYLEKIDSFSSYRETNSERIPRSLLRS